MVTSIHPNQMIRKTVSTPEQSASGLRLRVAELVELRLLETAGHAQCPVEGDDVRVRAHTARVEVDDAQALETARAGERNVRLSALKHSRQGDLHTVQRHALENKDVE